MNRRKEAVAFVTAYWQRFLKDGLVIDFWKWPGDPSTEGLAKVGFARPIDALDPKNKSSYAFDRLLRSVSLHILAGQPVPEQFRLFAADVLQGKRKRPPDPCYKNEHERDFALWRMVELLNENYGYAKISNGAACRQSAVDLVAEVTRLSLDTVTHAWRKYKRIT